MKKLHIIAITIALFSLSGCALLSNILGLPETDNIVTSNNNENNSETDIADNDTSEKAEPIDRLVKTGSHIFAIDKSDSLYLLEGCKYQKKVISEPVKNVRIVDNIINIYMKDGSLYEWYVGNDTMPKKINISEPIEGSLQSNGISYFDTLNGALYAYGYNIDGVLGVGNYDKQIISPTKINIPEPVIGYSMLKKNKSGWYSYDSYASTFYYSTYAVTDNGSLYVWGYNKNGELLLDDTKNRISPVKVNVPEPMKALEPLHDMLSIIAKSGSLYTALNYTSPLKKMNIKGKIREVISDKSTINYKDRVTNFALTEDGSLYAWGDNEYGQLGAGKIKTYSEEPLKVNIPEPVKDIIVETGSYYVITKNGSLYSWGLNGADGMLMNGMDKTVVYTPKKVNISGKIKKLKINLLNTYIITEDGSLYAWGNNEYGQLGIGNFKKGYLNKPVKVNINEPVKEIIVGHYSIYAVTKNGSLYSWGKNNEGQLGINSYEDTNIPTKVDIPEPVKQIEIEEAKYSRIVLTLTDNGSLYSWGYGKIKPVKCKIEY